MKNKHVITSSAADGLRGLLCVEIVSCSQRPSRFSGRVLPHGGKIVVNSSGAGFYHFTNEDILNEERFRAMQEARKIQSAPSGKTEIA